MQIAPAAFWRITFAEWRAMLAGYEQRYENARYQQAWTVSYLLIAAGCEADKVTPEKLLGMKEKKVRERKPKPKLSPQELFERMARVDINGKPIAKALPEKAEADGGTV